jgi:outer membrane protein assembly factor BamE (lipoprotein component of BamABCDE complex)
LRAATAAALPEIMMKTLAALLLAALCAACSTNGTQPYRPTDTTASGGDTDHAAGPNARSLERMYNKDGSLGTYWGT